MARAFPIALLTIAAAAGACWPSLRTLTDYWKDHEYLSDLHGYLIVAISSWLLWRARLEVEAVASAPSWPLVFVTALLSFGWYLAWISGLEIGYELLFLLILLTSVAGVVGPGAARALSFGIGYLCFAIPAWSYLSGHLQSLSTRGVTVLARLTGLPAYVEESENTVHIPSGSIEISGGCSGLNFLIAALAIAALYGELDRERLGHRVLLLAVAAVMAVVMNWLRIYGIILHAHMTDMKSYLVTVDHVTYGWILFGIGLVAFFWIARRLLPVGGVTVKAPTPVVAAAGFPLAFIAVLAALAVGPALTAVAEKHTDPGVGVEIRLPNGLGGWIGPTPAVTRWLPVYPQADASALGEYQYEGMRVAAYVNAYGYQAQGHEMVGQVNDLLGDFGWRANTSRRAVARARAADLAYVEVTATSPEEERWVIAYVYAVGGRIFATAIPSKLYYGVALLQGRPRSGVVAVASKCTGDCSEARLTVNRFLADNGSRLADSILQRKAGT